MGTGKGGRWQFWIDRGGTFTDCLGLDPSSSELVCAKVLSSDRAPLIGIRIILGIDEDAPIPPCDIRMGTTIATNALLERHGSPTALVISRGFGDALAIGNQTRAGLFDLDIVKPELLYREVVETEARGGPSGQVLAHADAERLSEELRRVRARGIYSLAVVVLHAYANPELEHRIAEIARGVGFDEIALSSEVANELGLVGRGDTTVVDAYLTPLIKAYVKTLRDELPGSALHIMQSSGDLALAESFRGKNAVLSGPAGGVVAYGRVAAEAGYDRAIGFDMGGTSTDVSCWDGAPDRTYDTEVAGVRLRAPMMDIHTVAAGGGSLCRFTGFRFTVGPASAGASPGPICYGHAEASELAVTDINLALGRIADDRFPFALDRERVEAALDRLALAAGDAGHDRDRMDIATGLLDIANANMAEAIRQVTIAKGRDARDYALVVFGGAGGQHGCQVARLLGIRTLLFDEHAGVLSALGMGLADVAWHGQADAGRRPLGPDTLAQLEEAWNALEASGTAVLEADGHRAGDLHCVRELDLRYHGTESAMTVAVGDVAAIRRDFEAVHQRWFGYLRENAALEMVTARMTVAARARGVQRRPSTDAPPAGPRRMQRMWTGAAMEDVPVYYREDLGEARELPGPCMILDPTGTIVVDAGFVAERNGPRLVLRDRTPRIAARVGESTVLDPIQLEIFANLFMSIATQMGGALRRTAVSTNIRDRLDFSCAVFDADGNLVANAPHIPVHLGAMSESIRGVLDAHPNPPPGSVFATNDPQAGGSHLPDITVITPVHDDRGQLRFFTASRGHHADIGGITPGSMPPSSSSLDQEGVVLRALPIVWDGQFRESELRALLGAGPYPARKPDDNIADLQAQIAANRAGARLLAELSQRFGDEVVLAYMRHVQDNAANEVEAAIARLPDRERRFRDTMDDGSVIEVAIRKEGRRLHIDFQGSSPRHPGNLNAPRAVTIAAVLYVLRTMVGAPIPLNSGCLRPVELIIPEGSILDPGPGAAVAAGNVETSQRIVDVLLGALDLAAASQGTMNNLTFGNERFGYYETIAGGAGATPRGPGASGVHTHMTNTRITDAEVLEARFPVRLVTFALRRGSGGSGRHRGGDGVIREFEFLEPMEVSIVSERRVTRPFGLDGGGPGQPGENFIDGEPLPGRAHRRVSRGARLRIATPGGGGWGS